MHLHDRHRGLVRGLHRAREDLPFSRFRLWRVFRVPLFSGSFAFGTTKDSPFFLGGMMLGPSRNSLKDYQQLLLGVVFLFEHLEVSWDPVFEGPHIHVPIGWFRSTGPGLTCFFLREG